VNSYRDETRKVRKAFRGLTQREKKSIMKKIRNSFLREAVSIKKQWMEGLS